jgi:hypothetical protein
MTLDEAMKDEKFPIIMFRPTPGKTDGISLIKKHAIKLEEVEGYVFDKMHSDDLPIFKKA